MKRILVVLLAAVLVTLTYYLFVRSYEYEVNFKSTTTPGDVIETIRIWNRSLNTAKIVEVDSFSQLNQTIIWNGRNYVYSWNFKMIDDSVTKVNIQISEPGSGLMNKILVPFGDPAIEKDANQIASEFYDVLKTHLEITRVKIKGEADLDSSFCICRTIKTSQVKKASGMMMDYELLTSFIEEFKLKPKGPPSVRVREWSHNAGSLKFDFCFPITKTDSLPIIDSLYFSSFKTQKALKAEFHGNYTTSDRAWYALIQYAEKNGYKVTGMPIEFFYDNPNVGINEKNWKAEVYLPIED